MNTPEALIIVDAQRCFIPAEEGERLDSPGFGELPVPRGQYIVEPANRLSAAFLQSNRPILTTQDQHPAETAHFADDPDYVTTWPPHGRADTPGGELHPGLLVATHPTIAQRFIKGDVVAASPDEDTSYTGALAHDPTTGETLPHALRRHNTITALVIGLALGDGDEHLLCVDSTAIDLQEQGFAVVVAADATEAVVPENKARCFRNLGARGIAIATTQEILDRMSQR